MTGAVSGAFGEQTRRIQRWAALLLGAVGASIAAEPAAGLWSHPPNGNVVTSDARMIAHPDSDRENRTFSTPASSELDRVLPNAPKLGCKTGFGGTR